MKHSIKGLFVILAIIMSLVAVQGVCAETVTVEGMIDNISEKPNMIVVDGTEVYGVRYKYLCNQYNICLEENMNVSIVCDVFVCSNGTSKNMATSITVDDVTVQLRYIP